MEKIAVLSDIHGNGTALAAVLADAKAQGAREYWLLGDVFLPGPAGDELLELLQGVPVTVSIRGNWDDVVLALQERKARGTVDAKRPEHLALYRQVQYLLETLSPAGLDYLKGQTATAQVTKSGLTIQLSHNFPDRNHGGGLYWQSPQEEFDRLCANQAVAIAIYGHVHVQTMRYATSGQLIINPGSIGQPFWTWEALRQDQRAQYALLTFDGQGLAGVDFRKVTYDAKKEYAIAKERGLPYLELYQELLETGVLHTHDNELLAQYNEQYGYDKDVQAYFNS